MSAGLALWLSQQFQVARPAATAVALLPALPGAFLAWIAYRDDRAEAAADTDAKAGTLAAAVTAAETRQRAQLIGPGAHRIDLVFRHRPEPANEAVGAAEEGRLTDVVAYYRRLRPARLVITGEPGSGKTLLALDLLLGLLTHPERTEADPVPVRLSLAGWNTDRPLRDWLAEQVHEQFRDRGVTAADAWLLVDRHRVLPVLDGLDEMDTATTPVGRRRAPSALEQLNAYQDPTGNAPVILTCRTAQYAELARLDVRMREAARVEITPVTPAQATAYLAARSTGPARWTTVFDTLAAEPGGTLAQTLSTPWRLNLAATAYEERRPDTLGYRRAPGDLLGFASPGGVRDHLLGAYLPAAISQHPTRPGRYRPDQTHRWLAALAAHLATAAPASSSAAAGADTDLVLHQLWHMAGRRRVRTADALLAALLFLALDALLLAQVPSGLSPRELLGTVPVMLLGVGALWQAGRAHPQRPQAVPLRRLRDPAQRLRIVREMVYGIGAGLVGGLGVGLGVGLAVDFAVGLAGGPVIALTGGLAIGLVSGLAGAFAAPAAAAAHTSWLPSPADPRHLVRDDLVIGLTGGLTFGFAGGIAGALTFGAPFGLAFGLVAGFTGGLVGGLYFATGAGRRYVVFLCCSRGRLPWRLGAFLDWAYGAGLLRISGTAYQFRHRELQEWLTTRPRA
ncbi:NACHT domain-containing protein [Streptomyces adelaidensis]|uniref:NACHT domain-containing protein n=1 Tax=Streptomyces adelaidensis TaxID=2796465 RepID=UPI00190403BC|nr:NACHT domain-containing protein [Streptomyces adelaidensis]